MTETYAATIAAVAPVVWLVAVIELHQQTRRMRELTAAESGLPEFLRRMETADGETLASTDWPALFREIQADSSRAGSVSVWSMRERVMVLWRTTAGLLLVSEAVALVWLGGPRHPDPRSAWICLCTTLIGFCAVAVLPNYVASREASDAQRREAQRVMALVYRRMRERDGTPGPAGAGQGQQADTRRTASEGHDETGFA